MNNLLMTEFRVYSEDVDHMGIVYHANYLKFYERARSELLRHKGYSLSVLKESGIQFAINEIQLKYHRPAFLDDLIHVETRFQTQKNTCLIFYQKITNECGILLSEAEIKLVCVNEKLKPIRLPKTFNTNS
tara:strand:+ start:150 stop:542 length:393 start_codon:yes stop_codon:yes gene_type:complete